MYCLWTVSKYISKIGFFRIPTFFWVH